jgi:xylan 1,4-beta-xylosidase
MRLRVTSSFRWTLLAAPLAWSGFAHAEPVGSVSISVDAADPGTPLTRVWPYYGYDEVNYTTSSEGKALLASLAAAHSAPVYVRTHFLFNSGDGQAAMKWGSTNVYSESAEGNPVYDWALTDGILAALTTAGTFPFVELGFMPEALSSHPTPYRNSAVNMLDGGCFYPPSEPAKWAELIRAWARHVNERYPNVAADWLWELWNEPDLGYWKVRSRTMPHCMITPSRRCTKCYRTQRSAGPRWRAPVAPSSSSFSSTARPVPTRSRATRELG